MVRLQNLAYQDNDDIILESSFDGESVFSIETAFNPFKATVESQRGLTTVFNGNVTISQGHGPYYNHLGMCGWKEHSCMLGHRPAPKEFQYSCQQENSNELFISPRKSGGDKNDEPRSSPHSIPFFPIPKLSLVQREWTDSTATDASTQSKKLQSCVMSKLPTRVSDLLSQSAPRRSSSLLSDAACYIPTSNSYRKYARENNLKTADSALHLVTEAVQSLDMDSILGTRERLWDEVSNIVCDRGDGQRYKEQAHSSKGREVIHQSSSKPTLPASRSPTTKSRRSSEERPPTSKKSPSPYIPLPLFSSLDDEGKCISSRSAVKAKSPSSTTGGRAMSPCTGRLSNGSAGGTKTGRPKAPMREGSMISPAKSREILLSRPSQFRSQNLCLLKIDMDRTIIGTMDRSLSDGKKAVRDINFPANPDRKSKSLKDKNVFSDMKPPSTPKRKSKSLKDEIVCNRTKPPSMPKQKSSSLRDDGLFSVVWQRSPVNPSHLKTEKNSERLRSNSEPPVAVHQRRLVGGVSRRLKVDEKTPSRCNKDYCGNSATQGRRKGGHSDPKKRFARFDNDVLWNERSRSCSLTRMPKKPEPTHEHTIASEPQSPNRFDAVISNRSDFPPMSPLRRGNEVDFPPMSPERKLSKRNSLLYSSGHDNNRSFGKLHISLVGNDIAIDGDRAG
ncbi:hypothetical protein IV203_016551 [Nitzschia inconspicua]|uniref:Uncharacterized protein n=1 Tax=Nitzschia inconspicua TaxID=303405 RepID=A0A9K3PIB5_9STRA|nr:hypothetical protein IV203_016551 [Nitzschia inconspicua]